MATKTSQRAFIWVIAIVMVVGTLAGFIAMILQPENDKADQQRIQNLTAEYQKEYAEYQSKVDAQTAKLSGVYFKEFSAYLSQVSEFDAKSVKKLETKDLKVGTGKELTDELEYGVYYIGWNPKAKMFDSSFVDDKKSLKRPLIHMTDGLWDFGPGSQPGSVIKGWEEGIKGMKVGGARLLTIPSDLAYGKDGQGEDIPADTPLKFIMMTIPAPEKLQQPEMPAELLRYYQQNGMQ